MNAIKTFDQKTLIVALAAISKGALKTRDQIQDVAVWAVIVSIKHADVSVANKLLEALGTTKSLRKDSLVAYFEKFGHMMWDKAAKGMAKYGNERTGCTKGNLTDAWQGAILGMKWDEAKKEPKIVSEWDMEEQLRSFLGRMDKIALDPANTIKNADTLQAARNAFNRIVSEKTLRSLPALEGAELKAAADRAKDEAAADVTPMSDREALAVQMKDGVQLAA